MKSKEFDIMLKAALSEANLIKYKDVLERSDFVEYSKDYINKIHELEESLDKKKKIGSAGGVVREKTLLQKKVVCAVLLIILIAGSVLAVSPAVRGMAAEAVSFVFKIIPTGERYIVSETEEKVYVLAGSVTVNYEDGYIKINSAYTSEGFLKIELEGNIKLDGDNDVEDDFTATGSDGKPGRQIDFDYMEELDTGKWSCFVSFEMKNESKYTLMVAGRNIPLILSEADGISQEDYNLYYDSELDLNIAAITEYKNDLLKVILITDSDSEDIEIRLPIEETYLITPDGKRIKAENTADANTVYFNYKLEEGIRLLLPYIEVYDNSGGSFVTGKNAGFDGNVDIGGIMLIIKDLGWSDYENKINMKKLEGGGFVGGADAQKIKLQISIDEESNNKLQINNVFLHTDDRNEYKEDGMTYIYNDPHKYETENENGIFIVDDVKADVSETEIKIESVNYRTVEEISILLRP